MTDEMRRRDEHGIISRISMRKRREKGKIPIPFSFSLFFFLQIRFDKALIFANFESAKFDSNFAFKV